MKFYLGDAQVIGLQDIPNIIDANKITHTYTTAAIFSLFPVESSAQSVANGNYTVFRLPEGAGITSISIDALGDNIIRSGNEVFTTHIVFDLSAMTSNPTILWPSALKWLDGNTPVLDYGNVYVISIQAIPHTSSEAYYVGAISYVFSVESNS